MNEEIEELKKRIAALESKARTQSALIEYFSDQIIFKKKVKFNANVYDAAGGVVTEINNL